MKTYKVLSISLLALLLLTALAGCGGTETASTASSGVSNSYSSDTLNNSYEGALPVDSQLMLGTLMLEESEQAVTPEQAAKLLPLWQALQGGITAEGEINAVLKQIEGQMTAAQLAAIATRQLTQDDLQTWMEENGGSGPGGGFTPPDDATATRQPGSGGANGGFPAGGGEMPPEMATRVAEMQNMSEEELEALRATAQASGGRGGFPGTGDRSGGSANFFLLRPLLQLLEERAHPVS